MLRELLLHAAMIDQKKIRAPRAQTLGRCAASAPAPLSQNIFLRHCFVLLLLQI